jgi:hypothetical protein
LIGALQSENVAFAKESTTAENNNPKTTATNDNFAHVIVLSPGRKKVESTCSHHLNALPGLLSEM